MRFLTPLCVLFSLFLLISSSVLSSAASIPGCSIGNVDYSVLASLVDFSFATVDQPGGSFTYFLSLCRPVNSNLVCAAAWNDIAICATGVGSPTLLNFGSWPGGTLAYLNGSPQKGIVMKYANASVEIACDPNVQPGHWPPDMTLNISATGFRTFSSASSAACPPKHQNAKQLDQESETLEKRIEMF